MQTGREGLLPDDIEYCRQDKFIVHSDGHVARFVERRWDCPHGVTQVHCPQQEEELRCEEEMRKMRLNTMNQWEENACAVQRFYRTIKENQPHHAPVLMDCAVSRKMSCSTQPVCNCGWIPWTINESLTTCVAAAWSVS